MLQMMYRASDVPATTTGNTAATSSQQTQQTKDALGVGAAVGIAIGVAVFVALIAGTAILIWRRKRSVRQGSSVKLELDRYERGGLSDIKNEPTEIDSGTSPRESGRDDRSLEVVDQPMTPAELQ